MTQRTNEQKAEAAFESQNMFFTENGIARTRRRNSAMIPNADANINITLKLVESDSISLAVCNMIHSFQLNHYTKGGMLLSNCGGLHMQNEYNAILRSSVSSPLPPSSPFEEKLYYELP